MHRIEIHHEAEKEIRAASQYYEKRVRGLGDQFLREIEDGFAQIQEFPMAWPVYQGESRRYSLKRFPYGLVYRIESESIIILAVTHLHQKPGYWQSRK
ncbi:MAG: type II toxin-antitoxin system RelE/ParE family toxin [bacterium]